MWPLQSIVSEKRALFWGFQHTFMGFLKEIDGKTLIFQVNPGMWPLKSNHLIKVNPVLMVSTLNSGDSNEIDGKMFIFRVNLGMWPLKSIVSEKRALFWGFQHTFLGDSNEIDRKRFIFRVNQGMWPLKSIVSEKTSPVLRVSTHIYGVSQGDRWENMVIFSTKPRHVTPQIDCLGKMSTVLRVSRDIYECFQGYRWENVHFSN